MRITRNRLFGKKDGKTVKDDDKQAKYPINQ